MKRLVMVTLTASLALGSAFASAASAAPMWQPVLTDRADVIQVRSDNLNANSRENLEYRHRGSRHYDRHDDRRYWHRERYRDRDDWRRDRWHRHHGPAIILDY